MNECARCTQARELVEAQRRVRQLERRVEKLKRIRDRALQMCLMLIASADQVLGRKSGVPRGTWAYAKGVKHAAAAIYRALQME
ncbi:MAG: hypothetical protein JXM73_25380 [Anaerolineae bacterium]|nr:hypothetical protein [Anaerolineae bacterium]